MFYLHRWSNVGILTLSYGPNVSCLILHCISAFWRCVLISGSYLLNRIDYSRRVCMYAQSLQSGLTLCNAMDCSPPGPSVHARSNILQARILEWAAMPSSRGSSYYGDGNRGLPASPALQADSLSTEPPAKPYSRQVCKTQERNWTKCE